MIDRQQPYALRPSQDFALITRTDLEHPIPIRFAKMVAAHADRLAVKAGAETLTYAELNERANRVAHMLLDRRGAGAEPIVLLFEHGAPYIVALMGVLKAGKFYVTIDPTLPKARIDALIAELETRLLLADNVNIGKARAFASETLQVVNVEAIPDDVPSHDPDIVISPDDLAYITFTTGSTGKPKGALATHRNVLHYTMTYTNVLHYGPQDRVSLLSALTAHITAGDLISSLLSGASVFPFSIKEQGLHGLADWLMQEEITRYCSVPIIFRQWVSALTGRERFPKLRLVRLGGDRVLRSDFELYKKHFPSECIFRNGYGASEILLISRYMIDKQSEVPSRVLPVGYASEDVEVLILDENRRPLDYGEIGEIAIKSRYLSPGYWKEPDLTAARFLDVADGSGERIYLSGDLGRMAPDGCLFHLGRKDFRVKVRGKLIAPIEIEDALLDIDGIKEAVVVAREGESGDHQLIAYYVAEPPAPNVSELRAALAATLPGEMVPAIFVALDAMPLNAGNKIDRLALPAPDRRRPMLETPFVAPQTPVEKALASIWIDVLALDEIGVQDRFLDLGGDSLLALQVAGRVIEHFGVEMPVQSLLEAPTISAMAIKIVAHLAKSTNGEHLL